MVVSSAIPKLGKERASTLFTPATTDRTKSGAVWHDVIVIGAQGGGDMLLVEHTLT
jgi:hypothetical protein